jgi:hypothetical protein
MNTTTQKIVARKLTRDFGFRRNEFELSTHRDADGGEYVLVRSTYTTSSHATRVMNCLRSAGFQVARVSSRELEVA